MIDVEFIYKEVKTIIQCNLNDQIENIICHNYLNKIGEEYKNDIIFLYNGNTEIIFNEERTFKEIINQEDKNRNKMTILVIKNETKIEENDNIKSNYIICPECGESIKIELKDYKIKLYECKNKHIIDNILLNEFEKIQDKFVKDIKCEICSKNKNDIYNKAFYICLNCEKNICPLCKSTHDKAHKAIKYDERLYICDQHYENYNSYCEECKKNLCTLCENNHKSHKKIYYGGIMPNKDELIKNNKKLKEYIDLFNHNINIIINILKEVKENMNIYYKINEDMINIYNNKNRNYEILYNLNKIKENNIINELKNIICESSIKNKFNDIFNIYCKMNINEINIIYKVENKKIKLFGENFVEINKNNCKIIINEREDELKVYKNLGIFDKKKDKLEIKLKGIMNIANMNNMFSGCSSLLSLPDISKMNTKKVTDISYMFYECSSLSSLPDISKWDINNVIFMNGMFGGCSSLLSLPDISKWNINKYANIYGLFSGCSSLKSLPDISKWNTSNVIIMSNMLYGCSSLKSLPDISNWNTNKVTSMSYMFSGCSSLVSLPDISNWNTNKVINIQDMFSGCSSLKSLPDISKWNINNAITSMNGLFNGCSSLLSLPNFSNWNTNQIKNISNMFNGCSSLSSLPDISKWNISNVTNMDNLFNGC